MLMKYVFGCSVFLVLDALWISFFALPLYKSTLLSLMADRTQLEMLFATAACYGLLLLGLCWFVLPSAQPILNGFVLGLVIYGVFALTNYIVFDAWTWQLTLSDGLWGGALYAMTAIAVSGVFK